jgi:hypothetical protein
VAKYGFRSIRYWLSNSGPDHVNTHQIWPSAAFFEFAGATGQADPEIRPAGAAVLTRIPVSWVKVLQVSRQSRKPIRGVPFNIEKRQGNGGMRRPLRTGRSQTQEGYNEDRGQNLSGGASETEALDNCGETVPLRYGTNAVLDRVARIFRRRTICD